MKTKQEPEKYAVMTILLFEIETANVWVVASEMI